MVGTASWRRKGVLVTTSRRSKQLAHVSQVYFARYGTAGAKEYQHRVPPEWLDSYLVCEDCGCFETELVEVGSAGPTSTGALENIPTVPTWSTGRMVLIGDAAHPTSPSSGQGASLAIESAVQVARCLRDLPPEAAFEAYEELRRARVERIIATAACTNSDKAAGPFARVLRDLLMPVAMKPAKPEKMAWQYHYDIDRDTPVAAIPRPVTTPAQR